MFKTSLLIARAKGLIARSQAEGHLWRKTLEEKHLKKLQIRVTGAIRSPKAPDGHSFPGLDTEPSLTFSVQQTGRGSQ